MKILIEDSLWKKEKKISKKLTSNVPDQFQYIFNESFSFTQMLKVITGHIYIVIRVIRYNEINYNENNCKNKLIPN